MVAAKAPRHERNASKPSVDAMAERFNMETLDPKIYVQPSAAKGFLCCCFPSQRATSYGTFWTEFNRKLAPCREKFELPALKPTATPCLRAISTQQIRWFRLNPPSHFISHFRESATVTMLVPGI